MRIYLRICAGPFPGAKGEERRAGTAGRGPRLWVSQEPRPLPAGTGSGAFGVRIPDQRPSRGSAPASTAPELHVGPGLS